MSAKTKKIITTIHIGNKASVPVDAENDWLRFKESKFEEQLEEIIDSFFWIIHLPWFNLPPSDLDRFWNEYSKPEAEESRLVAVHGLVFSNNLESLQLLNDAIQRQRDKVAGKYSGKSEDMLIHFALIGMKFAEIAVKKDHKLLKQLADVMKQGGIDGGTKGGEDSLAGQTIRDFCQLVATLRTLPTKKQLRESLGIGMEKEDSEKLRKEMKSLGLGGLPQER